MPSNISADTQLLLDQQKQLGEQIDKIAINFGKDSQNRKTIQYLQRKKSTVLSVWAEFKQNDIELKAATDVPLNDEYFTKQYHTKIKAIVTKVCADLDSTAAKLYPGQVVFATNTSGGGNTSGSNPHTTPPPDDQIKFKLMVVNLQKMLTTFEHSLDEFGFMQNADKTPEALSTINARLNPKWTIIRELHGKLVNGCHTYDATKYIEVEDRLHTYANELGNVDVNLVIPTQPKNNGNRNGTGFDNIKLPKITIPKFEGDYAKWNQFSELFNEMVDSTNISGTQKLMYLKQNIFGEAAKLVNHLLLTEANYDVAWDILKARYDNKRLIVSALLEKIFSVEPIKSETANAIKNVHDTISENIRVLRSMNINQAELSNIMLHYLVLKKLDDSTHQLYEQTLADSTATQSIDQLLEFMVKRFQALEAVGKRQKLPIANKPANQANLQRSYQKGTALISSKDEKRPKFCKCTEKHPIFKCPWFLKLDTKSRFNKIKKLNLCIMCFKDGHKAEKCNFKKCDKCGMAHNSLLHFETQKSLFGSAIKNKGFQHVFLATVIVNVLDKNANPMKVRALLDSGSQLNIMTEKMHRKLGISCENASMTIEGIGLSSIEAKKRSLIRVESQHSNYNTEIEVFIVKKITTCQPAEEIDISNWNIPSNIQLADPKFNIPDKVDMTIGGEIFFKLISKGLISIGESLPDLQNTVFGWIVTGKLLGLNRNSAFSGVSIKKESTLDQEVHKFWQVEERYKKAEPFTNEEEICEQVYEKTTKRDKNGKFIVRLQFSKEPEELIGRTQEMATRRFLYLEKRFQRDQQLREEYVTFMDEYEKLGHMEIIHPKDISEHHYFIPHHSVLNPSSSTTKFRVVFDASAKSTSNKSLNELLINGPILQDDLFTILTRFRKHQYVFSSDIGKMYRQILMHLDDQKWQLIVWRRSPLEKLKFYKLKTVTYGTKFASYLAIKSLQFLADIEKKRFPLASLIAKRDFNVDDVMTGADNIMEALQMQQELIDMLKMAGMDLHKWCANHPMLLETIPIKKQEVSLNINTEKTETKALGMKWIPKDDVFMLHYNQRGHTKITKRTILSETAQLFDPLGLVNPVVVLAKIFMQELWIQKIDWDEALPQDIQDKWKALRTELPKLNCVSIPRHMIAPEATNVQLHAFSDASTRAYGTSVYIRSVHPTGEISVNLVCSKSRVAPVNSLTLPRLELCGAMIMVEIVEKLKQTLDIKFDQTYLWTDSEIVLSWICNDGTYKTFVGNRVSRLKRKTKIEDWRYINTKLNPADLISRGVFPEKLLESELWWHGPKFLKQNESEWPYIKANFIREESEERMVKSVLGVYPMKEHVIDSINHRNSIDTLQRILAYCLKFGQKDKNSSSNENLTLGIGVKDLERAMIEIVRYLQKKYFKVDYAHIKTGHPEKTKFSNLSPILDKYDIIRVGGRLQASGLSFEQKHPALLPKDDQITQLILERIHRQNMHAGPQALLAATRQQFWPINGKRLAQSIVHKCVLCARHKPKLLNQVMGILPAERVEAARAFFHVGVDFAGPIMIHHQIRGKKPTKAYICLFVCFTTKAVHLEAATDMTTEAFINCLKRFIARRGIPSKIFSDNGTNFVGAKNILADLSEMIRDPSNQAEIIRYCWDHSIEWKFSPPRSPHFGGLWESAIKSAKLHLIKILHNNSCNYGELATILAEIEAILNSRPLTPMSNDPNDLQPLTAGHFLIGGPMRCINDQLLPTGSKVKMWTKLRAVKNEFWQRWSKEYLSELQYRHKWKKEQDNIKVGTLVTIKDENLPPLHWKMGRIESVIPDAHGKIRVVMVKTQKGIKKRAIHELCPLPVEEAMVECESLSTIQNKPITMDVQDMPETRPEWPTVKPELEPEEKKAIKEVAVRMTRSRAKLLNKNIQQHIPKRVPEKNKPKTKPQPTTYTDRVTRSGRRFGANSLVTTYFTIVIGFIALVTGAIGTPCNVTSFSSNPGLYFEEIGQLSLTSNDWILISYIKMDTFWQEAENINKTIAYMEKVCPIAHPEGPNYCEITQQFRHQFRSIHDKNELIHLFSQPEHSRKKRGWFDAGGAAAKEVFGLLNEADAKHFEEQIKQVNSNSDHLMNLIRNQTTIQEITSNIIKRDEEMMAKRFKYIQNEIDIIHQKNNMGKNNLFNSLALQTLTLIGGYREIQSTIVELLTKVYHGKIPPTVITPMQLKKQLVNITNYISPELMIPGNNNENQISKLYSMLTSQARVTNSHLIVRIKIPLIGREYFKLYYATPVPFITPTSLKIISPATNYIGINLKQDHYYMLHKSEREQCKVFEDEHIICNQMQPLYAVQQNTTQCEIMVLLQSSNAHEHCQLIETGKRQFWSSLSKQNQYLFAMQDPISISIICNTEIEKTTQHCSLHGFGTIPIAQQCMIKTGAMEISSSNIMTNVIEPVMLVPPTNMSNLIQSATQHKSKVSLAENWDDFQLDPQYEVVKHALEIQRANEHFPVTHEHQIRHYIVSYALIALLIVALAVYWCPTKIRTLWLERQFSSRIADQQQPEATELQPVRVNQFNDPIAYQTIEESKL